MEVIIVDAQNDSSKQSNDVEDLIQQGVDALLINPTDSSAISTAVESANSLGIPVIALDRSAEHGKVETLVASDNVKGGEMAADYLADQLGKGAKVAELQGVLAHPRHGNAERAFIILPTKAGCRNKASGGF